MAHGGFPMAAVPGSGQIPSTDVDVALGNPYMLRGVDAVPRTFQGPLMGQDVAPLIGQDVPRTLQGPPRPLQPPSFSHSPRDLFPNLASESGRPASYTPPGVAPLLLKGRVGEEKSVQQTAAYFFTLGLFCMFGPIVIMAVHIGMDPDASYWITRLGLFGGIVPVCILFQHLIQLRALKNERPVKRNFFLIVTILPAVFFVVCGGIYYSQAKWYASFLDDPKCKGEKMELEKAHNDAYGLWNQCVLDEKKKNDGQPLMLLPNLQSCPNFKEHEQKGLKNWKGYEAPEGWHAPGQEWTKEWYYLATAEVNHQCSGWCWTPNSLDKPMLWNNAGMPASSCQNYVAHKMLVIQHQGLVVTCVGILILVVSCPLFFLLKGPLQSLGHQ